MKLDHGQWNIPKLRQLLEDILPRNSFFNDFEVTHDFDQHRPPHHAAQRPAAGHGRPVRAPENSAAGSRTSPSGLQIGDRLRPSEIRYRRLFEAAKDGVLIVDPARAKSPTPIRSSSNCSVTRASELLEKELWEIGLLKDEAASQQGIPGIERRRALFVTTICRSKPKRASAAKWNSSATSTRRTGKVIQCNIRDITERKQADEERKQLMAREQAAREEAEAAGRTKDEFLATVSHELRTPLNPILGWSALLRTHSLDEAVSIRALESIERNAKVQAQLIEDILDVSRVITGKLSLDVRPVDLAQVIQLQSTRCARPLRPKSFRFRHILTPMSAWFGRSGPLAAGRLEPAIQRCQVHSQWRTCRHTAATPGVRCPDDCNRHRQRDQRERSPFIFDRFRQADNTSTRRYVDWFGACDCASDYRAARGTVQAESRGDEQGATFTVILPVRKIGDKEDTTPRGGLVFPSVAKVTRFVCPPQICGSRVLLVDDEPDTLEMLRAVLEQECRAEVRTSIDVANALEVFQQWEPDVLVSDIAMPGEDGYALIAKVRALEQRTGKRTPAIALTAYVRIEDRVRALQAGYDGLLPSLLSPASYL